MCLVLEAKGVSIIICFESALVIILRTLEHLKKGGKADTKGDWTVAAVERKTIGVQLDGDESNMGVIHCLQILRKTDDISGAQKKEGHDLLTIPASLHSKLASCTSSLTAGCQCASSQVVLAGIEELSYRPGDA